MSNNHGRRPELQNRPCSDLNDFENNTVFGLLGRRCTVRNDGCNFMNCSN